MSDTKAEPREQVIEAMRRCFLEEREVVLLDTFEADRIRLSYYWRQLSDVVLSDLKQIFHRKGID